MIAVLVVLTATCVGAAAACGGAATARGPIPSFAGPSRYLIEQTTQGLTVGDLNGDGAAEVVVTSDEGVVSVYLNRGDGRLRGRPDYAASADPSSVAIGDLNADGKPDLVVGSERVQDYFLAVLLNRGGGSFGRRRLYRTGDSPDSDSPDSVAIGDLDGDGKLDLVAGNCSGNSVSVLKNRGDGTFVTWRCRSGLRLGSTATTRRARRSTFTEASRASVRATPTSEDVGKAEDVLR